jgi:hypothetical protein
MSICGGASTVIVTGVRGELSQLPITSVTNSVVVALTELANVFDEPDCSGLPPVAFAYHLKVGVDAPLVDVTDAVGTPGPHCTEFEAVGALGSGKTVIVVAAVSEQPCALLTTTEYVVVAVGLTVKGFVVPTVPVPSLHVKFVKLAPIVPENINLGLKLFVSVLVNELEAEKPQKVLGATRSDLPTIVLVNETLSANIPTVVVELATGSLLQHIIITIFEVPSQLNGVEKFNVFKPEVAA